MPDTSLPLSFSPPYPVAGRMVRVALAGLGNVGRQVATQLLARRARYKAVYGVDVRLVAACGSRRGLADAGGLEPDQLDRLDDRASGVDFLMQAAPDVLIEAGPSDFQTGGPALGYLRAALEAGCDAVVISKGALVHSGAELRRIAAASGARMRISGATAAALPTIDLLETGLLGCHVLALEGVLNATTNYLLNAMMARGIEFVDALAEAQRGGFAEADPSRDIEGWDTACKLLILSNFGLDAGLEMRDLSVQGITGVTAARIAKWQGQGVVPRLVGRLERADNGFVASVGVQTYAHDDPFAHIAGKTKALRVKTQEMGDILTMGGGAEPMATASAALKDFELLLRQPR